MGLLNDLSTVQWVMIGVPLIICWLWIIVACESNGKRSPLIGLFFGPLVIAVLLLFLPGALLALIGNGVKHRKPLPVLAGLLLTLLLCGYVAAIVILGAPPPPTPDDLPVER